MEAEEFTSREMAVMPRGVREVRSSMLRAVAKTR